jgi:hypothetical protein
MNDSDVPILTQFQNKRRLAAGKAIVSDCRKEQENFLTPD